MALPDVATSLFGRYEFLIRRLHSLTGLVPLGGYLIFHLATNAAIIDGVETYQHRADQIHQLGPTTILILEWMLIFIPIIFHGVIGLLIVLRGKRNVADYPYEGNIRYTLQRWTGVIAFLFIFWHVFHMHGWLRFEWWRTAIVPWAGGLFDPEDAATAAQAIQAAWWVPVLYAIGVVSVVYHFANGLWTMGITWGLWVSPSAQQKAKVPIAVFGVLVLLLGLGSLAAMMIADVPHDPDSALQRQQHVHIQPSNSQAWQPIGS